MDISGGTSTSVFVQLSNGNGTFATAVTYSIAGTSASSETRLVDINGDGNLDLLDINSTVAVQSYLGVRLGNGAGGFGAVTNYTLQGAFEGAADFDVGDFNGDGRVDIVAAGAGNIHVRLGNGDGTFGSSISFASGAAAETDLEVGDFNSDGYDDFVQSTTVTATTGAINIYLSNGNGTFASVLSFAGTGEGQTSVALGDFNADGVLDIIAGSEGSASNTTATVYIGSVTDGTAPLFDFSLRTSGQALEALTQFSQKLDQLTTQRGKIGAFQSRAEVATNNLQSLSENYYAAYSRIMDADVASEVADMVRLQILQQATAAVLAQANQQPKIALKLLQGSD